MECQHRELLFNLNTLTIIGHLLATVNQQFWLAIIFGEFGKLRLLANICRANIRKFTLIVLSQKPYAVYFSLLLG